MLAPDGEIDHNELKIAAEWVGRAFTDPHWHYNVPQAFPRLHLDDLPESTHDALRHLRKVLRSPYVKFSDFEHAAIRVVKEFYGHEAAVTHGMFLRLPSYAHQAINGLKQELQGIRSNSIPAEWA